MKIFVDIDETICRNSSIKDSGIDYRLARPIKENIAVINRYYDEGHNITYWTARGTVTGIDWHDITKKQLNEWGAKHHSLMLGKPDYDLYIDDKSINTDRWAANSHNYNIKGEI
jgi:hypothetical protein|tara:strand:+ start:122 stop:463 length:342 start_codon:yes stop_codon:yes gene_type:complete